MERWGPSMEGYMQPQQIQIKATDDELKGRFASAAQIGHQSDHFVIDFFMVAPPAGQLVSRVVLTPGHAKGLIEALTEQVKQYEANFGKVKAKPDNKGIGFKAD